MVESKVKLTRELIILLQCVHVTFYDLLFCHCHPRRIRDCRTPGPNRLTTASAFLSAPKTSRSMLASDRHSTADNELPSNYANEMTMPVLSLHQLPSPLISASHLSY